MIQLQAFHVESRRRRVLRRGNVALLLLVVVVSTGYQLLPSTTTVRNVIVTSELPVSVYTSATSALPGLPVRMRIPALKVDAAVQMVGLTTDGAGQMAVPSNFTDVGWYELGVRPGWPGSAVVAGHLNGKNVPEAVFYDLDSLQVGDEVMIISEVQVELVFVVVRIAHFAYDDSTTEVFVSNDGKARLNLITCGGRWLADRAVYDTRTVVFTEQITDVR